MDKLKILEFRKAICKVGNTFLNKMVEDNIRLGPSLLNQITKYVFCDILCLFRFRQTAFGINDLRMST